MSMNTIGRRGRVRGPSRRGRTLAAVITTALLVLAPAFAGLSTASAAPKGKLSVSQRTGLQPGQNITVNLTEYPVGDVRLRYCTLVMAGFSMTTGECVDGGQKITITEKVAGSARGDASASMNAVTSIGSNDCTSATMCGFVTEKWVEPLPATPVNDDNLVRLTVAFGGIPKLEILDRAPSLADNSPIRVRGTNFRPNTTIRLTQCSSGITSNVNCRTTLGSGYAEPTSNDNGSFETTLNVSATYTQGGNTVDCLDGSEPCGVQTSSKTSGADATQQAMTVMDIGGTLAGSKTSGLTTAGEDITVTGTGYRANTALYLANCDTAVPAGGACDMANFAQVTTDASGSFNKSVKVASFEGTDCSVKDCALQTSRVGQGSDLSQIATLPLAFVAAPPAPTAKLTSTKTSGIKATGETVTVKGTDFQKDISLYLALCDTAVANGGACDMTNFKTVRTDANGAFTQAIKVGSFSGTDCLKKDCALQTSKVGNGGDVSQIATLPMSFVKVVPPKPKPKAAVRAPKVIKAGSTVTVRGSHFKAGSSIVVAECQTSAKVTKKCWTAKARTVKVNKQGAFTAKLKIAKTFKSKQGKVRCAPNKCSIKTWNKNAKAQRGSQVVHRFKFGKKTIAPATTRAVSLRQVSLADSGAKLSISKSTGLAAAGETITAKGSGFNPNVGIFVALCNTDVPNGGACDMANFKQVRTDASGSFPATSIKVAAKFTGGDGSSVDCMSDPCAVQTSQVGSGRDGITTAPVKFSKGGAAPAGGDTGGGDTSDDGSGVAGDSSGGSTDASTSGSSSGGQLPATGAGDELMLGIAGLLLLVGGLTLTTRRGLAPVL